MTTRNEFEFKPDKFDWRFADFTREIKEINEFITVKRLREILEKFDDNALVWSFACWDDYGDVSHGIAVNELLVARWGEDFGIPIEE